MFYTDFNLKPKTLMILSIVFSLTGVLFILASKYIGNFAIRLIMIGVIVVDVIDLKVTYGYTGKLKKSTSIFTLLGAIVTLFYPQFVVLVFGAVLLYFCVIALYNMYKTNKSFIKDGSNVFKLISLIIGIVFSIICIFNSNGMLSIVIKIIGAIMVAVGCFCFYQYINNSNKPKLNREDEYKFEHAEEVKNDED